jgi:hypothetical protein
MLLVVDMPHEIVIESLELKMRLTNARIVRHTLKSAVNATCGFHLRGPSRPGTSSSFFVHHAKTWEHPYIFVRVTYLRTDFCVI